MNHQCCWRRGSDTVVQATNLTEKPCWKLLCWKNAQKSNDIWQTTLKNSNSKSKMCCTLFPKFGKHMAFGQRKWWNSVGQCNAHWTQPSFGTTLHFVSCREMQISQWMGSHASPSIVDVESIWKKANIVTGGCTSEPKNECVCSSWQNLKMDGFSKIPANTGWEKCSLFCAPVKIWRHQRVCIGYRESCMWTAPAWHGPNILWPVAKTLNRWASRLLKLMCGGDDVCECLLCAWMIQWEQKMIVESLTCWTTIARDDEKAPTRQWFCVAMVAPCAMKPLNFVLLTPDFLMMTKMLSSTPMSSLASSTLQAINGCCHFVTSGHWPFSIYECGILLGMLARNAIEGHWFINAQATEHNEICCCIKNRSNCHPT